MKHNYTVVLEITEIDNKTVNVCGVWNNEDDYVNSKDAKHFLVYVYKNNEFVGKCINQKKPFYTMPTVSDCEKLLKEYYK